MKKSHLLIAIGSALVIFLISGIVLAEKKDITSIKRVVLKIESLSCGGCFTTINNSLTPLEGYSGMGANLWRKLVAVDFVSPLTSEQIAKTVTQSGYPATIEYVDNIAQKESFAYQRSQRSGYGAGGGCCPGGGGSPTGSQTPGSGGSKLPYPAGGSCGGCPVAGQPQPQTNL